MTETPTPASTCSPTAEAAPIVHPGEPRRRALVVDVWCCGVLALALALLAAGCGGSSGAAELNGLQRQQPLDVSSVAVTDARDDSPVAIVPAEGELTLVYFGYTSCPDVCPTTMSDVRTALDQIGDQADRVNVVFITADPERDTAQVLDDYVGFFVDRYDVVRLADPAQLEAVAQAFQASTGVTPEEPDGSYEVSHSAWVYGIGPDGKVVVEWEFGTPPGSIAEDLSALLSS